MTEIARVAPQDANKKNSPVVATAVEESTVILDQASDTCHWNDQAFKEGSRVCSDGTVYECSFGKWMQRKEGC